MCAAKLYNDCEWWIDNEDEEYIKNKSPLSRCRYIMIDQQEALTHIINTVPLKVSSCVSFLPTELLIVPDAMKYEMFRIVDISLHDYEKNDKRGHWHYFFFLKYLIKTKLGRIKAQEDATLNILKLLEGANVRHRDVAFNVLTWIFTLRWTHIKPFVF
ncbi:unnamed protein product [Mytilus edulis]|uniref:Uncharacterized protein n=1 Tax=Mytilus edulis TaxID=6550 RepID=A0A8S3Q5V8_MYTED|nr:unnamed protein product [Mytilus edulis]